MKKPSFFLFSLIFLFFARAAFANSGFTLEPKNFFLQTYPGKTIREVVTVKNLDSKAKNIHLSWQGYKLSTKHSINFARLNAEELELQPQGTALVEIDFEIPKDQPPADYYGSAVAASKDQKTQADFTIRVLGRSEENVEVLSFSDNSRVSTIIIANQGNQTTDISADIKIQNLFGQTKSLVIAKTSLKAAEEKTFSLGHSLLLPGSYQAKVYLKYGSDNQKVSFHSFWIRPEIFLIAGAIIIIVIIAMVFLFKRKSKWN